MVFIRYREVEGLWQSLGVLTDYLSIFFIYSIPFPFCLSICTRVNLYVNGCGTVNYTPQCHTQWSETHANYTYNITHGDRAPTQHKRTAQLNTAHGYQAPVQTANHTTQRDTIRKHTTHDGSELLHLVGFFKELKFRGWRNCFWDTLCAN